MNPPGARISHLFAAVAAGALLIATACGGSSRSHTQTPNPAGSPAAGAATSDAGGFPLTLQRSDGKPLTLTKPPSRIVSLSPGATEIIYALHAEARLIAVDKNADYPGAAKTFPEKVDAYEPNVESIAALGPDLVIVASDTGGLVAKLDELKIPVLYNDLDTDVKTTRDVLAQIHVLGQVTGANDQAAALITSLSARIDRVRQAVDGARPAPAPVVYHELDETFFSASDDTFVGDLYRILHVTNIAGDGGGVTYPQLTQEKIIAADPTIIVLADEAFGVSIDSVKARPGWSSITAVHEGRIFALDADIISRPGPRIVDALEQLARDIYPTRFN